MVSREAKGREEGQGEETLGRGEGYQLHSPRVGKAGCTDTAPTEKKG